MSTTTRAPKKDATAAEVPCTARQYTIQPHGPRQPAAQIEAPGHVEHDREADSAEKGTEKIQKHILHNTHHMPAPPMIFV